MIYLPLSLSLFHPFDGWTTRDYDSTPTEIYRLMLTDKKYGLTVSWMATRVMPSLLPQTINTALNLEQFEILLKVLQDMLNHIER